MSKRSKKPTRNYEVGYRKPPKEHQYKPKQSGNPKGRKKKSKSPARRLRELLAEPFTYTFNGKRVTEPLEDIIFRKHAGKSAEGDVRSLQVLITLMARYGLFDEMPDPDDAISESDQDIIKDLLKRLNQSSAQDPEDSHDQG